MSDDFKRRLPFNLSFKEWMDWLFKLLMFFLLIGMIYLRSIFATGDELGITNSHVKAVEDKTLLLTPRVENLERAVIEDNRVHIDTSEKLNQIKQELSAVRAGQNAIDRNTEQNFDRIFRKLDTISPR